MSKCLIFISCGQKSAEEKSLGMKVKGLIDSTAGFEAYFAEAVHDLGGLKENIYKALTDCSGAVVFLHDRGTFKDKVGESSQRSSTWINQEIAILSYRQHYETQKIPVLAFKEDTVSLDGAMTSMIVNPLCMTSEDEMIKEIQDWLRRESFGVGNKDVFDEKWALITDDHRNFLACLIDEGESEVKEEAIRKRLVNKYSLSNNDASRVIRDAKLRLTEVGFVLYTRNSYTGHEFSLHDPWKLMVLRKIGEWKSGAKVD